MSSGDAATPEARSHRRLFVLVVVVAGTPVLLCLPNAVSAVLRSSPVIRAESDVVQLWVAVNDYAVTHDGAYPSSLEQLLTPAAPGHYYLDGEVLPKDPWNREYHYTVPTATHPRPRVWSYGADGAPGGTGHDADIDSDKLWEVKR